MAPRKMTDKRPLKLIEQGLKPYLQQLVFGANLHENGLVDQLKETSS